MYICIHAHIDVRMYICAYICMCACAVHVYGWLHIAHVLGMYVCMYACMYAL